MKKLLILSFAVLIGAATLQAQEINAGLNFQVVFPQNEFKESINTNGLGMNVNGLYRFAGTPFGLGLDFNFNNFGKDTRDEPLSSTIPDLRVRVENEYNLIQLMMMARLQPRDGVLRPYLEGLAGFNYFYTETSITDRRSSVSDPIASDTNFEDWAFAWGGGGGLMIRVFDFRGRENREEAYENIGAGYINLGVRYLNGSEAEYLREGSIVLTNGDVEFDTLQSRTDMLMLQIGFVFRF